VTAQSLAMLLRGMEMDKLALHDASRSAEGDINTPSGGFVLRIAVQAID
jgi:hypothetical protein